MKPFTDEDMRRLKEELQERTSLGDLYGDGYLGPDKMKALLARLEAVELILNKGVSLTHTEDCDKVEHHDLKCTCGSERRWEAWRKKAGK